MTTSRYQYKVQILERIGINLTLSSNHRILYTWHASTNNIRVYKLDYKNIYIFFFFLN